MEIRASRDIYSDLLVLKRLEGRAREEEGVVEVVEGLEEVSVGKSDGGKVRQTRYTCGKGLQRFQMDLGLSREMLRKI